MPANAYEQVRESTKDLSRPTYEVWAEADRLAEQKRREEDQVRQDPELSEEGRANRFREIAERYDSRIRTYHEKAASEAAEAAERAYLWSIPAPGKNSLANTRVSDSNERTAVRLEASSILERAQHRKDLLGGIKPVEDLRAEVIREALNEALKGDPDDPDTRIQYLGAIRAAKDTVGLEAVVEREPGSRYERYLSEHYELQRRAKAVPVQRNAGTLSFPKKPKKNVRGQIRGQDPGARRGATAGPSSGTTMFKRRGRHW
jgi:hypothetical protein